MKIAKTYNFINITKTEFQPYQVAPITDMQASDIQTNLFGVINLLLKWQNQSDTNKNCA